MRKTSVLLAIGTLAWVVFAPSVEATPIAPGDTSNTPDQFSLGYSYSPPGLLQPRNVVATTSNPATWGGSSGFFGTFYEQVEADPGNVYCSNCLDFRFQVYNDSQSNADVLAVELAGFGSYLTDVGWEIESVDGSYECGPDDEGQCNSGDTSEQPVSVYRSSDGNTVGFNLGGIVPDDASVDLVIETNALTWADQSLNVLDAAGLEENGTAIGPGRVIAPTVPEPATSLLLSVGLLLLAALTGSRRLGMPG